MATSKSEICNLALSRLGSFESVSDIDTPDNKVEKIFTKWYDTIRKKVLKSLIPNFAVEYRRVSQLADAPAFGYAYKYEYPNDCLKVLGIDEVEKKTNDYAVRGRTIQTDLDDDDGLPIRFIKDITDVTWFNSDFITLLTWELAYAVCMEVTQDLERMIYMEKILPKKRAEMGAMDSQENAPVRINKSKWKKSRYTDVPVNTEKK